MTTVVVCGARHSGTSLVAGALRCLGVFMGDIENSRHEDKLFSVAEFKPELLTYIALRDREHSQWGFKWVFMRNWFSSIYPFLKNPKFIYCYRSHTERAKLKPEKYDNRAMFCEHLEEGAYWGKFFKQHSVPLLIVDFNTPPNELLNTLIEFLQLAPTTKQLQDYYEFHNKDRGYIRIEKGDDLI